MYCFNRHKYPMIDRGYIRPLADLLFDERKGKFLTPAEKTRVRQHAEEQRKKKLKK